MDTELWQLRRPPRLPAQARDPVDRLVEQGAVVRPRCRFGTLGDDQRPSRAHGWITARAHQRHLPSTPLDACR
jgi:hypothetical protein